MTKQEINRLWHPVWHLHPTHCKAFQILDVGHFKAIGKRGKHILKSVNENVRQTTYKYMNPITLK